MAQSSISHVMVLSLFLCLAFSPDHSFYLNPNFYEQSCPKAEEIVRSVVEKAVQKETRMAASLLRLHFHDCSVLRHVTETDMESGCDASLLLDNSRNIRSEKQSNANTNSARGFEVIDDIKSALEKACPQTVSCADVLALAARDSTVLAGGPNWAVSLGRRDSKTASLSGSNRNIPQPNNTFQTILTKFKIQGLNIVDFVALSGSHTIGNARCTTSKGLFNSDQVLLTKDGSSMDLVKQYAENNNLFFEHFAQSMVKMGNLSPLIGSNERSGRTAGELIVDIRGNMSVCF
ncbi:hypothetical protein C5167_017523 [Papaver somniferum]|uniref:Peroxidase n=1 Tax=Papaver somniferum TaxID=3469 RepID=A0A4Y7IJN5_PAPSO|nr:hypothetical protein C5167_017523 [Papaver somniferum]